MPLTKAPPPEFDKTLLPMPIFNHLASDGGPKRGANKGETDSLHFPEHSDHLYDFHVADELQEFVVEVDEEDVHTIDPILEE